jgi:RNA polymerase sigma-70 factor (ECF subfamily)
MPDKEDHANNKEQQIEQLYAAISRLNKDDRSIILLYLEEKTYEEMAEITGLTVSNIGVKINRLKKKLFQILNELKNG